MAVLRIKAAYTTLSGNASSITTADLNKSEMRPRGTMKRLTGIIIILMSAVLIAILTYAAYRVILEYNATTRISTAISNMHTHKNKLLDLRNTYIAMIESGELPMNQLVQQVTSDTGDDKFTKVLVEIWPQLEFKPIKKDSWTGKVNEDSRLTVTNREEAWTHLEKYKIRLEPKIPKVFYNYLNNQYQKEKLEFGLEKDRILRANEVLLGITQMWICTTSNQYTNALSELHKKVTNICETLPNNIDEFAARDPFGLGFWDVEGILEKLEANLLAKQVTWPVWVTVIIPFIFTLLAALLMVIDATRSRLTPPENVAKPDGKSGASNAKETRAERNSGV
jgi:hypothetical protein